jgi:tRNA(fMet)-specific endonuclease VapC
VSPENFVLVDTDVFIDLTRGKAKAARFLPLVDGQLLVISFVTVAELWRGAYRRGYNEDSRKRLQADIAATVVVTPTEPITHEWARLTNECRVAGHPLGKGEHAHDAWIAATARHHSLPLLTGNRRHFERCPGLQLVEGP